MTTFDDIHNAEDEGNNYWCEAEPNVQRAWSASSLNTFQQCQFKYYLTYVLGLSGPPTPAQIFGLWGHEALGAFDAVLAVGGEWINATHAAIREVNRLAYDWETDDNARDSFTLMRAVVWYCDKWKEDYLTNLRDSAGEPMVETSFKIALPLHNPDGDNYLLTGFLDGAVVTDIGDKFIRERKFTKQTIGDYYFKNFKLDNQASAYTLAGHIIFEDDFAGIMYDAVQTAVNFSESRRHIEERNPEQIEEWIENTMQVILDAERAAEEERWTKNYTQCGSYGGCVFREYCGKSPSVREGWLPEKMEIKRREIIDYRGLRLSA